MKKSFKIGGDIKLPLGSIPYSGKGVWVSVGFSGSEFSDAEFEQKSYDNMDLFVKRFLEQLNKRLIKEAETLIQEMVNKKFEKEKEILTKKMDKIRSVVVKYPEVLKELKSALNKDENK